MYPNRPAKPKATFDEVVNRSSVALLSDESEKIKERTKILILKIKEAEVDYEKNVAAIHRHDVALLVTQRVLIYLNEKKCKDNYPMVIHTRDSQQDMLRQKHECVLFFDVPSTKENTTVRFSNDEITIFIDDFKKDESFRHLAAGLKKDFIDWNKYCHRNVEGFLGSKVNRKECERKSSIYSSMKHTEKRLDESAVIAAKVKNIGIDINVNSYIIVIDTVNNRVKVKPEYLKI